MGTHRKSIAVWAFISAMWALVVVVHSLLSGGWFLASIAMAGVVCGLIGTVRHV